MTTDEKKECPTGCVDERHVKALQQYSPKHHLQTQPTPNSVIDNHQPRTQPYKRKKRKIEAKKKIPGKHHMN
jgi:hypothetical protein